MQKSFINEELQPKNCSPKEHDSTTVNWLACMFVDLDVRGEAELTAEATSVQPDTEPLESIGLPAPIGEVSKAHAKLDLYLNNSSRCCKICGVPMLYHTNIENKKG